MSDSYLGTADFLTLQCQLSSILCTRQQNDNMHPTSHRSKCRLALCKVGLRAVCVCMCVCVHVSFVSKLSPTTSKVQSDELQALPVVPLILAAFVNFQPHLQQLAICFLLVPLYCCTLNDSQSTSAVIFKTLQLCDTQQYLIATLVLIVNYSGSWT